MNNVKLYTLYHQKIRFLPFTITQKRIETSYGFTNILITDNKDKPPLFLVHGLNSAAPFVLDLLSSTVNKYQVFAIDILGQPNKSECKRLNKKDDSYGKWLLEIIDKIQVDNITFCGISFGAFPIIKSLLMDETKVKEAFLISPASFINGSLWKTIFRFLVPMKQFKKTKNDIYLKKCLHNIYDEFDEITFNYQREVFLNFKMDFSLTPNFKKENLQKITVPISIVASNNDFFVPAQKLKKRCQFLKNMKNFISLENSNHIPSKSILEDCFKTFTS